MHLLLLLLFPFAIALAYFCLPMLATSVMSWLSYALHWFHDWFDDFALRMLGPRILLFVHGYLNMHALFACFHDSTYSQPETS